MIAKRQRYAVIACGLAGAAVLAFIGLSPSLHAPGPLVVEPTKDGKSDGQRVEIDTYSKWIDSIRDPVRVDFVAKGDSPDDKPRAAVQHLGPLEGADMSVVRGLVNQYCDAQQKSLQEWMSNAKVGDPSYLKEEAHRTWLAEMGRAARVAMEQGSYVVMAPPENMTSLPGCEVLFFPATRNGDVVNISIVMPKKEFSDLAAAADYRSMMEAFFLSEASRTFAERPYEERMAMLARYRVLREKLLRGDVLGADDAAFMNETMAWPRASIISGEDVVFR
ncbi:MAG: hypothetical protein MUC36_27205 [Planctomycetes bacterium]|jgi:hypothetical protein|nr:hypothetical protein [Planctomycetota bacterium]